MKQEHFDIDQIIGIELIYEKPAGEFDWVDATPEKRKFFGLIKVRSARPAGFLDYGSFQETIYTEEELKEYGYKVYPHSERIVKRVCRKPYVKVHLPHDLCVTQTFESDDLAKGWVDELKSTSGKTFEVVF
jgi:hypothetical protein